MRQLEQCEIDRLKYCYHPWNAFAGGLGGKVLFNADFFAGALPQIDIVGLNRVIGLGLHSPVTMQQLETIIHFYKEWNIPRFYLAMTPLPRQESIIAALNETGFCFHNNTAKLFKKLDPKEINIQKSAFIIKLIDKSSAQLFGNLITTAFEWPSALSRIYEGRVGLPGWRHYILYSKDEPISCAALYIKTHFASLSIAGTLHKYRGLGAQSALIAHRVMDAVQHGCRYAVVETAENTADNPSLSYLNMIRKGFLLAYKRANFIFYT